MLSSWKQAAGLAALILAALPARLLAAGGGSAQRIVMVADSRGFTGVKAWWTNLYNDSHFYFALVTIIVIPLLGAILGFLTDFLLSRIGIDLRSRTLAEH